MSSATLPQMPKGCSSRAVLPRPYLVGTGKACPQLSQQPNHSFTAVALNREVGFHTGQGLQETQVFLHNVPKVCHEEGLLVALGESRSEQQSPPHHCLCQGGAGCRGAAELPALTAWHSSTRRFSRRSLVVKPSSTIMKLDSFK